MNPERAMVFLGDLHKAGWAVFIGARYTLASHYTWGHEQGRGDDLASQLDDLRNRLRDRELCE